MNQPSISKMFLALIVTALMLSTVTHYSAFGQFRLPEVSNSPSTQSEEPATEPPLTDDLGQTAETAIGGKVVPPSSMVTTFTDDTGVTINHVPPGWTGSIMDSEFRLQSVDGDGDRVIPITCEAGEYGLPGTYSVTFQKTEESGSLSVAVVQDGRVLKEVNTVAAYGVVSVSGEC